MSLAQPTAAEKAWQEDYAQHSDDLPGSAETWLADRRAAAMRTFTRLGLPHRRLESWKYTDLRTRLGALEPARPSGRSVDLGAVPADPFAEVDCDRAVFVGGFFRPELSQLPRALEVTSLAAARLPWSKDLLGGELSSDHSLAALNLALARDGVLIRVPKGMKSERPLHVAFVSPAAEGPARAMHVRNAILVEEGAQLTFLESHRGQAGAGDLINLVWQLLVAESARLDHLKLIAESDRTQHLSTAFAELGKGASYRPFILTASAALARTEVITKLTGPEAQFALNAATLANEREHIDITTFVEHAAPNATSRQVVKSVIGGHGRGIYQGKIIVREGANGTDSHQLSKSILLSPNAEADTKPELEIYADDVKCGHGATAGALDENALFYLRSRGISEASATAMLLEAFIEDAVAAISNAELRAAVSRVAAAKLERMGGAS